MRSGVQLTPQKALPCDDMAEGVLIQLHADGTWSGDGAAFIKGLEKMTTAGIQSVFVPSLWMIAAIIKRDLGL